MPSRVDKLLFDIVSAGEAVQAFVAGRTRNEFEADLMLRSAVERQLEIAGEAVRRLRDLDSSVVGEISEYQRIIDFRNVLAHGYDSLSPDIIWQAVSEKLPILLAETRRLRDRKPEA